MKGKVVGWKGRENDTVSRKLQLFKGFKGKRNQRLLLPQMYCASHMTSFNTYHWLLPTRPFVFRLNKLFRR